MSRTTMRCCGVFALLCLAVAPGAAQGGPGGAPEEVTKAQTLFQSRDFDGAIKLLEDYFLKNPAAVSGRLLLANAYRDKGDLDKALAAYLAIAQPRPMRLQAQFNAAGVYALQKNTDEALKLLEQVKGSGAFDVEQARTAPAFEGVRKDPRFEAAMFQPGDFVRPFVEDVKIIHEFVGETKGDQFSWIARGLSDVNGDGVRDVVTSAPTHGAAGNSANARGRVYVYSGKTGRLIWTQSGQPTERLGTGLEGAGDVNADGIADVIAGAPGTNRAYVYSGRDGKVLLTLAPATPNEGFGGSASGAGDQNGDGFADVVVGASASAAAGVGAGRAYVFSGKDGSVLLTLDGERAGDAFGSIVNGYRDRSTTFLVVGAPGAGPASRGRVYVYSGLSKTAKFIIESDETGSALGAMFASVVGDVNGDKVPDIYASDYSNSAKGPSTGRVYVHSGATGERLQSLTGEGPGGGFGIGSADVGDVDKDGFDDLLIGAWQYSGAAPSGGKVYLYSGKDGHLIRAITGRVPGETFGFDATGVGDVDGDGVIDLLLTSTWSNIKGFQSGRMFIISGK
ncbi:MAG: tetratricopeptide repeat protein [Gemmatimonadales bacterium]|nr:tetratricopeptide repeat protein [Gemmatimonadales bacterium]